MHCPDGEKMGEELSVVMYVNPHGTWMESASMTWSLWPSQIELLFILVGGVCSVIFLRRGVHCWISTMLLESRVVFSCLFSGTSFTVCVNCRCQGTNREWVERESSTWWDWYMMVSFSTWTTHPPWRASHAFQWHLRSMLFNVSVVNDLLS